MPERRARYECSTVSSLTQLMDAAYSLTGELEDALVAADGMHEAQSKSFFLRDKVLPVMARCAPPATTWNPSPATTPGPCPTYGELLYGVK